MEILKPFAFSPCGHCYYCSFIHLAILNYPILTCFECRTPVELIIPNWLVIAIINQTNQYGMPVLQPDTIIEYNQRNTLMHLYNQRDQNAATVRLFILYLMLNDIYEEIRESQTIFLFHFVNGCMCRL